MSKDLLVLADEYAAATATFARALALKDEADSMSPIAREAGDKRAVLAEALAALDTARPEPRPTEDALWDETLKDRDAYHQFADDLAAQIAAITGVDIGEHSSANNPWQEAMLAADDFIATQLKTMLLQQTQPSQADAQDAARYRWIRLGKPYRVVVDAPTKKKPDAKITIMASPSPESDYARALDAAIDAAINAKGVV